MNSRSKTRKFVADDVTRYTASLKRDGGLRAAFMSYEAFDRDAIFAANGATSRLSKIPALAIVCQSPVDNMLQRQLVAAGLKNVKGVILDGLRPLDLRREPRRNAAGDHGLSGALKAAPVPGSVGCRRSGRKREQSHGDGFRPPRWW